MSFEDTRKLITSHLEVILRDCLHHEDYHAGTKEKNIIIETRNNINLAIGRLESVDFTKTLDDLGTIRGLLSKINDDTHSLSRVARSLNLSKQNPLYFDQAREFSDIILKKVGIIGKMIREENTNTSFEKSSTDDTNVKKENHCFVIQPFDNGGEFDKRYNDIFVPAIEAAGLKPYRVDEDLSADVLIEKIHEKINTANICLADISEDNPNIWYELGYATARLIPLVMVSKERKFPFDMQHRAVIKYRTDSPQDFQILKNKITKKLNLLLTSKLRIIPLRGMMHLTADEFFDLKKKGGLDETISYNITDV